MPKHPILPKPKPKVADPRMGPIREIRDKSGSVAKVETIEASATKKTGLDSPKFKKALALADIAGVFDRPAPRKKKKREFPPLRVPHQGL